ncbi:unnamed protein product, partial [Ectocarpus sp. 13 AM-2016]
ILVLDATVHDGPASPRLRNPDHPEVGLREPQDHALPVPARRRGRQPHRGGDPGRRCPRGGRRTWRISRRDELSVVLSFTSSAYAWSAELCWQVILGLALGVVSGGSRFFYRPVRSAVRCFS